MKICDRLSAEKVICPSVYAFRKNGSKSGNPDLSRPYHWAQNTVRKMLSNQYIVMPKLTPELLRVFIRRIEVYEKFEKYSRTAGNPIIIRYTFRLPEQEGVPAIEVLAQTTAKTA